MAAGDLSYEQACEMAYKMREQGVTFPKIADHFKAIGYKSAKTKEAVGSLSARHMAAVHEKLIKQELKEEKEEDAKIYVVSPVGDVLSAVEKILDFSGVSDKMKISMAKSLIRESAGQNGSAAPVKRKGGRPKGSTNKAAQ